MNNLIFEKGKTYKFDKDSFISNVNEHSYNTGYDVWIKDIENIEFTPFRDYEVFEEYEIDSGFLQLKYGVLRTWCTEVRKHV